MNYTKIINHLPFFLGRSVVIEKLIGGVTNANFKITDGSKKYVAKFGFESNKYLGIDRRKEIYNHNIAAKLGIASRVVQFYSKWNLLLVEYLDGKIIGRLRMKESKNIVAVAGILRKIHKSRKFKGVFNPFATSRDYFSLVKDSSIRKDFLKDLGKLKLRFGRMDLNYSTHLDLVPLNILQSGNKIMLLDWEYSARSDYRFDLAMISAYADFEPKHDKLLIKSYGRKDLNLEQLNLAKAIMLIREIGWDLVQLKYSKLDFDYMKYARGFIKRYNRVMKDLRLT